MWMFHNCAAGMLLLCMMAMGVVKPGGKAKAKGQPKPKGKAKAKGKAKPLKYDVDEEDIDEEESEEEADEQDDPARKSKNKKVKRELPAMPKNEVMGMHQILQQMKANGEGWALQDYQACKSQQEKRQWFQRFKVDKKCSHVKRTETRKIGNVGEDSLVQGWMTKEQVAFHKLGLAPGTRTAEEFATLRNACVKNLDERIHPEEELAALGIKQYDYTHIGFHTEKRVRTHESGIDGAGDVGASNAAELLGLLGSAPTSADTTIIELEEHVHDYVEAKKEMEKCLKVGQKHYNSLKSTRDSLSMDVPLQKLLGDEIADKMVLFMKVLDQNSKDYIDLKEATGKHEMVEKTTKLAEKLEAQEMHNKELGSYMLKVKRFVQP